MTGEKLKIKCMINVGYFGQGWSTLLPWCHCSLRSGQTTCGTLHCACSRALRTNRHCLKHLAQLPGYWMSPTAVFSIYIQVLCSKKQWFNYRKWRLLIVPSFPKHISNLYNSRLNCARLSAFKFFYLSCWQVNFRKC